MVQDKSEIYSVSLNKTYTVSDGNEDIFQEYVIYDSDITGVTRIKDFDFDGSLSVSGVNSSISVKAMVKYNNGRAILGEIERSGDGYSSNNVFRENARVSVGEYFHGSVIDSIGLAIFTTAYANGDTSLDLNGHLKIERRTPSP